MNSSIIKPVSEIKLKTNPVLEMLKDLREADMIIRSLLLAYRPENPYLTTEEWKAIQDNYRTIVK